MAAVSASFAKQNLLFRQTCPAHISINMPSSDKTIRDRQRRFLKAGSAYDFPGSVRPSVSDDVEWLEKSVTFDCKKPIRRTLRVLGVPRATVYICYITFEVKDVQAFN